jgi:hypothetical protein
MAAGSSVTWTHYSIRYEVTWGKKARVRADSPQRPRGHRRVRADATMRPCGRGHLLTLALPLYPFARPARTGCCVRADAARLRRRGADVRKFKNKIK